MTCSVCYCGQGRHSGAHSQRLICFSQVCCHCTPEQWPHNFPHWGEWLLAHAWLPTAGDGLGAAAPWAGRALTALEMLHREGCRHWWPRAEPPASEVHLAPQASSAARGQARPVQRGATSGAKRLQVSSQASCWSCSVRGQRSRLWSWDYCLTSSSAEFCWFGELLPLLSTP